MRQLYHASDAAFLPSRGEGLPLFVQEAMSCGLPTVITADEIYAAELLAGGVCLGAAAEAGAVTRGLEVALAAPEGVGPRAREYAVRHWGMERMIERYVAIFERLTGPSRPRPDEGRTA